MDTLTVIGLLAGLVGIVAGIVQVVEYIQNRRRKGGAPKKPETTDHPVDCRIPNNLPPRGVFIGRETEKKRVREALDSRAFIVSIDGIGGIGKTSLALEVAYELLQPEAREGSGEKVKFDGLVWTTAKDRELRLNHVLDAVATTLDYPGLTELPIEDKTTRIKRLLQGRRILLIIDNFETITDDAIQGFLYQLPEPSKALITTREQTLRNVWAISLKGLGESEAISLMRSEGKYLGLTAIEHAEEKNLIHLYQATGGAPLAIKWSIGQIKQKGQSIDTVLQALHEARGNIFDSIFNRSWAILSPDSRLVLTCLSLFVSATHRVLIEAGSDLHHYSLDDALGQLVEMSLVDATDELDLSRRRYAIHSLTRAFSLRKLGEFPGFETAAKRRIADCFLRTIQSKPADDYRFLDMEKENILSIIAWCYESNWEGGHDLAFSIKWFLWELGFWQERLSIYQKGYHCSKSAVDSEHAGQYAVEIGWTYYRQANYVEAQQWADFAREEFSHCNPSGIDWANLKALLGMLSKAGGDLGQSELRLKEALEIYTTAKEYGLEILRVMTYLGELAKGQQDFASARYWFEETLNQAKTSQIKAAIAWSFGNLGEVAAIQGEGSEARRYLHQGLELARTLQRKHTIAQCLYWLAKLEEEQQNYSYARQYYLEALANYERMGIEEMVSMTEEAIERMPAGEEINPV